MQRPCRLSFGAFAAGAERRPVNLSLAASPALTVGTVAWEPHVCGVLAASHAVAQPLRHQRLTVVDGEEAPVVFWQKGRLCISTGKLAPGVMARMTSNDPSHSSVTFVSRPRMFKNVRLPSSEERLRGHAEQRWIRSG